MKMSNIRKAFDRALARLGVDAERYPRGVHGLRHAYKAMLEGLGMSPEEVRKAMHHVSVGSQRAYGETTARLNERMTLLLGGGA
jgi:integrase